MSEDQNVKKQILLGTTLDELGIKGFPLKKDIFSWRKEGKRFPTLAEFFEANRHDLPKTLSVFKLYPISVANNQARLFVKFLIKNGFTVDDWVVLCPRKEMINGREAYDLKKLSQEQIENLRLDNFTRMAYHRRVADVVSDVMKIVRREMPQAIAINDDPLYVRDILVAFNSEFQKFLLYRIDNSQYQKRLFQSLFSIQSYLKKYGFNANNGIFMTFTFPWLKSTQFYIDQLVNEKNFSLISAQQAVAFGIRAGWIRVSDD